MKNSKPVFITCFLKGAIPSSIIRDVKNKYLHRLVGPKFSGSADRLLSRNLYLRKRFIQEIDHLLDRRQIGPHFLNHPDIFTMLDMAIQNYNNKFCDVVTYKILSNHFHMLVGTQEISSENKVQEVDQLLDQIKTETAFKINHKLKRIGPVWEEENFNLEVNNSTMMRKVKQYIDKNSNDVCEEDQKTASKTFRSKTIKTKNKSTSIYSEFRPGIVI